MESLKETLSHTMLKCRVGDLEIGGIFDHGFFNTKSITDVFHRHVHYEIYIMASGCCEIEDLTGNRLSISDPNSVLLIAPNSYHNSFSKSQDVCKYAFRININRVQSNDDLKVFDRLSKILETSDKNWNVLTVQGGAEAIKNIMNELQHNSIGMLCVAESYFKIFIISLLRKLLNTPDIKSENALLEDITDDFITRNNIIEKFFNLQFSNPNLTIETLSQELNLSPRQINRIFQEHYNTTFRQMLIDVRLNHAKKMLLRTDASIEKISYTVGYRSLSAFLIAFKKKYHSTPTAFRKDSRNAML